MTRPSATGRVVLVETSEALPGLLPFQAWDALASVDRVHLRDPASHPAAPHLHVAGLDLVALEPAALERADLDLTRPGGPEDRRLAKALVAAAREHGSVTYLLDPDEAGLAPALAGMVAEHDIEIELVLLAQLPVGTQLLRSVAVMDRLRDPDGGCPWDLEQDHESLARYLVEETYELIDAIAGGDDEDVREELGDVLLQVLFHARIAGERRAFGIDDVARGLSDKLVRRHPHVFADGSVETADDVQRNWDRLKSEERGGRGPFDGVPRAMPGLALLDALLRRARRSGMLPDDARTIAEDLAATAQRLVAITDASGDGAAAGARDTGDSGDVGEALGALLLQVVGLARTVGLEADDVARTAAGRWRARADELVELAGSRGVELVELEEPLRRSGWPGAMRTRDGGGS